MSRGPHQLLLTVVAGERQLLLSFDGHRLRAAAASEAGAIDVDGSAALGVEWRELEPPFELRFGGARLMGQVVGAPVSGVLPDFAAVERGRPPLAGAASSGLKTQLLDLSALRAPALEGHATLSVGSAATPFQIASGSTLAWSLGNLQPAKPASTKPEAQPAPALDRTLCDRGALRDYARQLAASASEPVSPGADPREPVERWATLLCWARALPLQRHLLALAPRRRLLVLPVLASLAVLPWLLGAPSAAQGSRASTASAEAASADHSAPLVPLTAGAVPPPPEALATTPAPDAGVAPSEHSPRPASKRLEHDAFRAAFGGNVTEAVALYEELAQSRGEPVFEHAARLVRQNRVHKP